MQAMISLSNIMLNGLDQAEFQLPSMRLISLTGLLFFAAAMPIAGQWESLATTPIEDSHQDLNLAEVTQRFVQRLPQAHKSDAYMLARTVMRLSERHMVSPGLLLSVVETESSFRYDVVSKAGAVGLMQLRPSTAAEIADRYHIRGYHSASDLTNPVVNLELGTAYLAYLRSRFGESVHYLAAYNMGPTAMTTRIRNGQYELGALTDYVEKLHRRTLELRRRASVKSKKVQGRRFRKLAQIRL